MKTIFGVSGFGVVASLCLAWEMPVLADNPMRYFRSQDARTYSNSVRSIRNVQDGKLYVMTWDEDADYHLDRLEGAGCTTSMGAVGWLCTNVLDRAPVPKVVTGIGCSSFAATNAAGDRLVGRNLDYRYSMTHAVLYVPRNESLGRRYASVSTVDCGWLGYDIGMLDDGTNDLSYAALFPHLPMDGMNEKGLAVSVLSLDARTNGPAMTEQFLPGRASIGTATAIRHLLDSAATTDEAVGMLTNRFNLFAAFGAGVPVKANYHLYISDCGGDNRVVEWLPPGRAGESWTAWATNATAVANFYLYDGYGHGSNRYEVMRHTLDRRRDHLEEREAMDLLAAVAQRKGASQTSWTHWSVVYNLSDLTARIATLGDFGEVFSYRIDAVTNGWTFLGRE